MFERRLEQLREWWTCHGGDLFESADEWINSMSNVELLEALSWFDNDGIPFEVQHLFDLSEYEAQAQEIEDMRK